MLDLELNERIDIALSAKNVGPDARNKLKGLLKHYASKKHPFRACVRDNRKRFGPGTEAVCATLKDLIRGTTKWRGNADKDVGSAGLSENPSVNVPDDVKESISKAVHLSTDIETELIDWSKSIYRSGSINLSDIKKISDFNASKSDDEVLIALHCGEWGRLVAEDFNNLEEFSQYLSEDVIVEIDKLTDEEIESLLDIASGIEIDSDEILPEPPEGSGYRLSDDGGSACVSCDHFAETICLKYVALADSDFVCNDFAQEDSSEDTVVEETVEMSFSHTSSAVDAEDGVWKSVLKTGTWALSPGGNGSVSDKPLTFVRGSKATDTKNKVISLDDIVENFNDQAIEHVTVPLEHTQDPDKNTGMVKQLKIVKGKDGVDHLKALINFTDDKIRQKVLDGSIANTSVGLLFGRRRTEDKKLFPVALDHVALTNKPWINGLPSFGLSENNSQKEHKNVFVYEHKTSKDEQMEDKEVDLSQLKALQEENDRLKSANSALTEKDRLADIDNKILELSERGLCDHPGLLKKIKEIFIADNGEGTLQLSTETGSETKTISEVIEDLVEAFPTESLRLSEQARNVGAAKPEVDANKELSHEEKVALATDFIKSNSTGV